MFQEILQKISTHVDGVMGCMLLDHDSVPISQIFPNVDEESITMMAVEVTNLLASLKKRNALEEMGQVEEFMLTTERLTALCRIVGGEYILLLALAPNADIERGRTMLRLMSPWIEKIV